MAWVVSSPPRARRKTPTMPPPEGGSTKASIRSVGVPSPRHCPASQAIWSMRAAGGPARALADSKKQKAPVHRLIGGNDSPKRGAGPLQLRRGAPRAGAEKIRAYFDDLAGTLGRGSRQFAVSQGAGASPWPASARRRSTRAPPSRAKHE